MADCGAYAAIVNDRFTDYNITININSIKLGFMRIVEEGYPGIPVCWFVWDFYVRFPVRGIAAEQPMTETDDPAYKLSHHQRHIDGFGIMNRALGY